MRLMIRRGARGAAGFLAAVLALPVAAQQCGDTITVSTRLQADLFCPAPNPRGYALRVDGPNVVLDLGGHVIDTSGRGTSRQDIGVLVENAPGAAVLQGTIIAAGNRSNGRAIEVRDSPAALIEGITVMSSRYGVVLRGAPDSTVSNTSVDASNFSWAFVTDESPTRAYANIRLRLVNNHMRSAGSAGNMFVFMGESVRDSIIEGNKGRGLYNGITLWTRDARGLRVFGNHFTAMPNAGMHGIYLAALDHGSISSNLVEGFQFGIFLHEYCCGLLTSAPTVGGRRNRVTGNVLIGSLTGVGFGMPAGTGTGPQPPLAYVERNRVFDNRIEDAGFAFRFGPDARDNDALGNTLVNVSVVAEDFGAGNQY
jgi:hypothetical protein